MQEKKDRMAEKERIRQHFAGVRVKWNDEMAEQREYTRMEIALRMMLDNVPDEKVARYTRVPMLIIESMYGLRDEIRQRESEAKSKAMKPSFRTQDTFSV